LKTRVVIIGNGIAGFSAAAAARRLSPESEILIASAETEPLYSPCVLPDYISGQIDRERTYVKGFEDYARLQVERHFGRMVERVDADARRIWLDSGKSLAFERLVLALGSSAVEIGEHKQGTFVVKSLRDADALIKHQGRRAVVIGSGAIGIEVAIALKKRGYEVEILETQSRILPLGMDPKAANRVQEALRENGIGVALNEKAAVVIGEIEIEGLKTDRRELKCDTIVWAIGMKPNVNLARAAGIRLGPKGGIEVNSRMETSVPGVFACGDCVEANDLISGKTSLNLFWHNANRQGRVAGCNSVGFPSDYLGSENMLNLDVFGRHVVGFGLTVSALKEEGMDSVNISVIEDEMVNTYSRLVFAENRCVGAQFINPGREAGLIWGLVRQRKPVDLLFESLRKQEAPRRRALLTRVKPLFRGRDLVKAA
jgi:NADPH-dependent 2,4-dienoyl-CoA reductase/sulfur reductase-like enzyme